MAGNRSRCRLFLLSCFLAALAIALAQPPPRAFETQKLRELVREFQNRTGSSEPIAVFIIGTNSRLASVRRSREQANVFVLEVDEEFLSTLTEEERRAMIAHELGHVWIFTHHPFLQSERLANQRATQLVTQESLTKLYEKVWQLEASIPLAEFLSNKLGITQPEPATASPIPALSTTDPAGNLTVIHSKNGE